MTKKVTKRLADDIRASLREVRDHAAGKRTRAIVHKVTPRAAETRVRLRRPEFGEVS